MNVEIANLEIHIEIDEVRIATAELDNFSKAGERAAQSTAALDLVAQKLNGVMAAAGADLSVDSLIRMSDEYAKLSTQLRLATESQSSYATAYGEVKRIATEAQQDLGATAALYAQVANATSALGISQRQVAAITETVSLSMKASGASAAESALAQQQLAEAFTAGSLSVETFNSLTTSAPVLVDALSNGLKLGQGALQQMAASGELTAQVMATALPAALQLVQEEARKVETIGGAFTILKNSVMEFVGTQSQASGVVSVLSSGIRLLADNIGLVVGAAATLGSAKLGASFAEWAMKTYGAVSANSALLASNLATASSDAAAAAAADAAAQARVRELRAVVMASEANVALAVTTNGLIPAEANAARTAAALAAANTTLAGASTAASVAARALNTVLSVTGGPIGLLITVIGAAATAWSFYGNKAKEKNDQAVESFDDAQARIVKGLDEQIAKNERLIQMQKGGMSRQKAEASEPYVNQLAAASKLLNDINTGSGDYQGKSSSELFQAGEQVKKDIAELVQKMQKADQTKDTLDQMEGRAAKEGAAAARALAVAKATADAKYEAERAALEREKALRMEGIAAIEERHRQGLATEDEVFNAKHAATLKAGEDAARLLGAEIDALKSYHVADQAERISHNAKIARLEADRVEVERAAAAAAAQMKTAHDYDKDKPAREAKAAADARLKAVNEQADAIQKQVDSFGQKPKNTAATITGLVKERDIAAKTPDGAQAVADIDARIEAYRRLETVQEKLTALESGTEVAKAKALADMFTEVDEAARQAAQGMEASFGSVGKAIGGLTTALTGYARTQATIASQLEAAKNDAGGDQTKIAKANATAAQQNAQAQMKAYGQMATAAKGFFKENTTGYKVMEGAEKAFRAYETAMAIENMLTKSGLLTAFTSLFVASKATEQAADATATGQSVANSGMRAAADGVAAFAKTLASLPFPANIAAGAAVLALLAGVGVAIAGGGGGADTTAKDRQEAAGTGSVFGDSKAKSDSIAKSLELVAANSDLELSYTRGMLYALRSIESSLGGLGNLLIRTAGLSGELAQGSGSGGFLGAIGNAIFGGKVTTLDTGVMINPAVLSAILANGVTASQYTDTKKDGGWFSSDKYRTQQTALGTEANQQIAQVIAGLATTIGEAGKLLGLGGTEFTAHLNSFVVDIGKISLKGLKGEEIQKQLEAVFSKLGDDMAKFAVDGLSAFQKVGEGYFETLARIASNYANLDSILTSIGMKFGATGIASIGARENLINMAGGIDKLAEQASGFADNFLTEAERLAPVKKYVADQLAEMGYASIDTREAFKQLVLSLNAADSAQGNQLAKLLDLQDAFAKVYPAIEDTTKSTEELREQLNEAYEAEREAITSTLDRMNAYADSLKKFQDSLLLNELSTLTPEQRYQEAKAQFDRTFALAQGGDETAQANLESSASAYLKASQLVNASGARYQDDFAKVREATSDALQWAEKQVDVARASLTALEKSVTGLIEVKAEVVSVAQAIRELSGTLTASQLATVGANSTAAIETLYQQLLGRHSDAEGLAFWKNVLAGGTSIAEIARLFTSSAEYQQKHPEASSTSQSFVAQAAPSQAMAFSLRDYGTANTVPLVEAIRDLKTENAALTTEIRELRAEQQRQTGDAIQANYDANARGAAIVAEAAVSAIRAVSEPKRIDPI